MIAPYQMAGGPHQEAITGSDQMLLSITLFIYPQALADQVCRFMCVIGRNIYDREQTTQRFNQLEISQKRGSKEAYDAFSVSSIRKIE